MESKNIGKPVKITFLLNKYVINWKHIFLRITYYHQKQWKKMLTKLQLGHITYSNSIDILSKQIKSMRILIIRWNFSKIKVTRTRFCIYFYLVHSGACIAKNMLITGKDSYENKNSCAYLLTVDLYACISNQIF